MQYKSIQKISTQKSCQAGFCNFIAKTGRSGLLLIIFIFFSPVFLFSQIETTVVGQITDKYYKTPIPSVNVYFKNTHTGTASNEEGYFIIRSLEDEKTLIFSCIGYKTKEIKVKIGEAAYLNVEMEEENTLLMDVFVYPGVNPALDWMKKIRLMRKINDISNLPDYKAESTEQDLILLSKVDKESVSRKLFDQVQKGSLSSQDSTLLLPLYMAENEYEIISKKKQLISKNTFTSPEVTDRIVVQLLNGLDAEMNFYNNSVIIFGKSLISPLSSIGNTYYNYFLVDSIGSGPTKQYEIHFLSKNPKNLAFDGFFRFDSTSLAITHLEARLPRKANLNYIQNLTIKQEFEPLSNNIWAQKSEDISMTMTYAMLIDSVYTTPEILLKRSVMLNVSDSINISADFAKSGYSTVTLEDKLNELDNTPLMRTAKWIADAALTGYARVGFIDIGKLQQIIRLTDVEGLRLNLPLRTNERLWKNISIGGYVGYGFKNKEVKYSAFGQFRLPVEKRHIFGLSYTDDYRRIDYDYNNFIARESPWNLGDEDAISTIFSLTTGTKVSPRKEWAFSYVNDWNKDIESATYIRANRLYANQYMPLAIGGHNLNFIQQQSVTFSTRFSFDEKKYEDHLQRIYIGNRKPVIYGTIEAGQYQVDKKQGYYAKIMGSIKQNVNIGIGQWNYMADAGFIIGKIPYPFLEYPPGNEPSGISFYQFNRMKYMEFGADKYLYLYNEFIFNGILFNYIPGIKYLNLRELISIKAAFTSLSDKHREVLDFPDPALYPFYLQKMKNPYLEASFGITNILRILTVQVNWRITNNYEGIQPWRFSAGLRFDF